MMMQYSSSTVDGMKVIENMVDKLARYQSTYYARVVCIVTGGNIETATLSRVLERGMALEGRLIKFKVTISDQPGGMSELCSIMANLSVMMRGFTPERAWVKADVFSVVVWVIAETRGWEHNKELMEALKNKYPDVFFQGTNDKAVAGKSKGRRGPCLAPTPACMLK